MRGILVFAVLALMIGAAAPRFYLGKEAPREPHAVAPAAQPQPSPPAGRSLTVRRGDKGHFEVEGTVDGRRMAFLVDTGASVIALRERDAGRLGIHPARRDYTAKVTTANGVIPAAPVELNRVDIGGLVVYNVAAIVLPDEALGQNLLGMSFLSRVRFEHRNGRLVLEQ
jgi:aspartyl protease family protein